MSIAIIRRSLLVLAMLLVTGCASIGNGPPADNPEDPWESVNRRTFAFNEALDAWVLKPLAQGYDAVAPSPVRVGVANFFGNVEDVWTGVNSLLQGKPVAAAQDLGRVVVNSTMGIGGLLDVASAMGIEKHSEDFGQTLAVWGVGNGPYVVLPLFGPRTLRDAGGFALDLAVDPVSQVNPDPARYGLTVFRLIDVRAGLLPAEKVLDSASLDKYSYLRSAYLQRRRSMIFDGNPPREEIPEE